MKKAIISFAMIAFSLSGLAQEALWSGTNVKSPVVKDLFFSSRKPLNILFQMLYVLA